MMFFGLPKHPLESVREKKICSNREWLASKSYPSNKRAKWANKRKGLKFVDFTAEVKIWLYIICNGVSSYGNVSDVSYVRCMMIACILDGIHVNVNYYIF